jgi:hypothetical protein
MFGKMQDDRASGNQPRRTTAKERAELRGPSAPSTAFKL